MMKYRIRHANTFDMTDIEVYTLVLNDSVKSYPTGFWEGVDGYTKAKKILKHVFIDILQWSMDDIKQNAKMEIVDEYKLRSMINNVFNGSIYIAIGETFPELKEWADNEYRINDTNQVNRYTDEELIRILVEKAKELNRIPKGVDMTIPGYMIYANRFGSWDKSLIKAGLIEDIYEDIDFEENTKDKVVQNLKSIFAEKERVLEKKEILDIYPEGIIKEYFGAFNKVEREITNGYTDDELIKILKDKKNKLGRIPSNKDMNYPRAILFIDRFGSWENTINKIK